MREATGAGRETADGGHGPGSKAYRRLLVAMVCAGLATFGQLYSPQGVLPLIASQLNVSEPQSALLISAATIGLAIGSLPWAWLADRIGRLTAMKASMSAAIAFGVAGALVPGFEAILVLRVLEGFALGGVPAVAIAYVHDEVTRRATTIAVAVYVSGTSVGGLAGRILAAPFAEAWGWRAGVIAVLAFSAVATVVFLVCAPGQRGSGTAARRSTGSWRVLFAPGMLTLYAQGFLLMGGFVALYNYLGFRLQAAPFGLNPSLTSLLFLAYLAGTFSSQRAGRLASRAGRLKVLVGAIAVFVVGILVTLASNLIVIVVGLVILTAGFFAAHAIASGWTGARARAGGAQAPALYNVAYYAGSSLMGWLGGFVFTGMGWPGLAWLTVLLAVVSAGLAVLVLRGPEAVD